MTQFKKILIVNIFGIGDVLFTTPIIQNIKNAMPNTFVGYMGNARTADFLENNPQIDKVFVYEKDEYRKLYKESKKSVIKPLRPNRRIHEYAPINGADIEDSMINTFKIFFPFIL